MSEKNLACTLNTKQFAQLNGVEVGTVRSRVCNIGHYFGVKPLKLANGRLLWPATQVQA